MRGIEAVTVAALAPGDLITEIDSPSGPWYTVLSVDSKQVVVDGSHVDDHQALPVVIPIGPNDLVLRSDWC